MKVAVLIARLLMGAALTVFGLNGFLHFFPEGEPSVEAASFVRELVDSGYLMELVSGVQLVSGVCLLTGAFVPLGLVLFAPIVVNIVCFHLFVDEPSATAAPGFLLLALELFLAWIYAPSFRGVLSFHGRTRLER